MSAKVAELVTLTGELVDRLGEFLISRAPAILKPEAVPFSTSMTGSSGSPAGPETTCPTSANYLSLLRNDQRKQRAAATTGAELHPV